MKRGFAKGKENLSKDEELKIRKSFPKAWSEQLIRPNDINETLDLGKCPERVAIEEPIRKKKVKIQDDQGKKIEEN
jgi:hypothetical protein